MEEAELKPPKEPKDIEAQIGILKEHGCLISDKSFAEDVLSKVNYYRLSAYFLPFKKTNGTYISGTTFKKVFHIYEFDRELRSLLFRNIECIETALRTRLSYMHAIKYGACGYLNPETFNKFHNVKKFQETIDRSIGNNRKNPVIIHHKENYNGQFPIWVIIEFFTFGDLSFFYKDLLTKDKKEIARKQYHIIPSILESWLRCCTDLRNICAHGGRLYYRNFSAEPSDFKQEKRLFSRSLWALILIIKWLYPFPEQWEKDFIPQIETLMNKYSNDIDLKHLCFPQNWKAELKKSQKSSLESWVRLKR
ncbi:MAG: Abi family protein [Lachnospiraceae bacterium]|nr:Abi family protein [Lachnospiraceae bacterium]